MQDIPAFPISAPPVILRLDGEPEKEISSAFLYAEIKPFILFDGHFPFFYGCIHSISWVVTIFNSLDKHDGWFSMQEMGFSSYIYIYCPTACGVAREHDS